MSRSNFQLRFSDRKRERYLFQQMLRNESQLRGLIVHSNGSGGVGKSTLLRMFNKECDSSELPTPPKVFYFTAERPINWRVIVDSTVRSLGEENFTRYVQVRSLSSGNDVQFSGTRTQSSQLTIQYVTNFYGNVEGQTHTGSGNIELEGKTGSQSRSGSSQAPSIHERVDRIETAMKPSEIRQFLTQQFLQDLNSLEYPLQLVWLVDTVEKLDEESTLWLTDLFWELAEQKTQRLILVAAGRERLHHHPQWIEYVEEILLSKFTEEAALEILLELHPAKEVDQLHRMLAKQLIAQTGGEPIQFTMILDNLLKNMGVVYA